MSNTTFAPNLQLGDVDGWSELNFAIDSPPRLRSEPGLIRFAGVENHLLVPNLQAWITQVTADLREANGLEAPVVWWSYLDADDLRRALAGSSPTRSALRAGRP